SGATAAGCRLFRRVRSKSVRLLRWQQYSLRSTRTLHPLEHAGWNGNAGLFAPIELRFEGDGGGRSEGRRRCGRARQPGLSTLSILDTPMISVVVPTCERPELVARCLAKAAQEAAWEENWT